MIYKLITVMLLISARVISAGNNIEGDKILISKTNANIFLSASETSSLDRRPDGTLVCWTDDYNGGSVCVQKINTDLNKDWGEDGIRIDTGLGELSDADSDYPLIFSDRRGGAIIIYKKKSFDREDIYVREIYSDGSLMRGPVCLTSGSSSYNYSPAAALTPDMKLIVVWESFSNGNFDIHAQKIDMNCKMLWNGGIGITVAGNNADERIPVVACGSDLIFISWLDARNHAADYMFDLYACKMEKSGFITGKEKLIHKNQIKTEKNSYLRKNNLRKELMYNHNAVAVSGNSFVMALEDSRDNMYSRTRVIMVNDKLDLQWDKIFRTQSFQTKPLIVGDANSCVNIFWNDFIDAEYGISGAGMNIKGEMTWGGENGIRISDDDCKNIYPRIIPSARNKNGILILKDKAFLPWVTLGYEKLFLKNINLTGESNQIGFTSEIQDEIIDGECTSVTTQMNNLMIVYVQSNSLYAAVRKIHNENSEMREEKVRIENFPNPFNPSTHISFNIPNDGFVRLSVYDIAGRKLHDLVQEFRLAGNYVSVFDARMFNNGAGLASGVYFCRMETNGYTKTIRMTLIK